MSWVDALVQGVLLGGLYALVAAGLTVSLGVLRVVDLAHGQLVVTATFLAWTMGDATGVSPLLNLALVVPIMFSIGYALQLAVVNRVLPPDDALQPLLVTFAIAVVVQNGLSGAYGDEPRTLDPGVLDRGEIRVTDDLSVGWVPLLGFVTAVVVVAVATVVSSRTRVGRTVRASADDAEAATLLGVDVRRSYARAAGAAAAIAACGGVFLGAERSFGPSDGPAVLVFGFEAMIIGGTGSLWGTLVGGIVVGVAQSVGAEASPGWGVLAGHVVFLAVLASRPSGLVRRAVHA